MWDNPEPSTQAEYVPDQTKPRARILLIEDSAGTSDLITRSLGQHGYQIDTCYDGPTGLEAAVTGDYDLLLLDIALPGMFGWEVLRQIRDAEQEDQMPVIVVTAHHDTMLSDDTRDVAKTVVRVMSKPFDLADLARTVAKALGHD